MRSYPAPTLSSDLADTLQSIASDTGGALAIAFGLLVLTCICATFLRRIFD